MFKTFAIAATAIALTAGAASANSFGFQGAADENSPQVTLNLVRADAAGTVVLESLTGDVLAMAEVDAGANTDVILNLEGSVTSDVVAKLIIDGAVEDTLRIRTAN
ncbi:MAG: hypothetical protein AAF092_01660 [Pseudomonadota bacterium]